MDLDEVDRKLIGAVLEDADRSLRELGEIAGVSKPTVSARLERLEELGLLGPARRDVDLGSLGELVLLLAPPGDLEDLVAHPAVFRVHRTHQNKAIALALLIGEETIGELHRAFPEAETHVLTERILERAPPTPGAQARVPCSQCGKLVEGGGLQLKLGGKRYVACCTSCERLLRERYQRHDAGA